MGAVNLAAQVIGTGVTSLTQSSATFTPVRYGGSNYLSDGYDFGTTGSDISKQSGIQGANKTWDMIGNTTSNPLLQIASGTYGGAAATYFRVRLADYVSGGAGVGSGSVIVYFDLGVGQSFGVAALFGNQGNLTSEYYITPNAGTSLTANFQYSATAMTGGGANYSAVTTIDGNAGAYTNISTSGSGRSGVDAYLTFAVLNSNLTNASGGAFAFTTSTRITLFTNNTSTMPNNINSDFISFNSTGANNGDLAFGTVPEPATWLSTGALLLTGVIFWWRRSARRQA